MSNRSKKTPKTRSSKKLCQERRSCEGEKVEAAFKCSECDTYQCCLCEKSVHKDGDPFFHTREPVCPPSARELCSSGSAGCPKMNYADVRCNDCNKIFCFECDAKAHSSSKRRGHSRVVYKASSVRPSAGSDVTPVNTAPVLPPPTSAPVLNPVRTNTSTAKPVSATISCVATELSAAACDEFSLVGGGDLEEEESGLEFDEDFLSVLEPKGQGQYSSCNGEESEEFHSIELLEAHRDSPPRTPAASRPLPGPSATKRVSNRSSGPSSAVSPPEAALMDRGGGEDGGGSVALDSSPPLDLGKALDGLEYTELLGGRDGLDLRGKPSPTMRNHVAPPQPDGDCDDGEEALNSLDSEGRQGSGSMPSLTLRMDLQHEGSAEYASCACTMLMDANEILQVESADELARKLSCSTKQPVKVVSIFGNTGDGKSFTLNHCFFGGREVFATSDDQTSCTVGIWAAYVPDLEIVVVDTEGLLGVTVNQNQRTRLLLKVLAISDVVLYRSRADRLHTDLFQFLGDASRAYTKHFTPELKATISRMNHSSGLSQQSLGPTVIVFHETQHTNVLGQGKSSSPDSILRDRFQELGCDTSAFAAIKYVGTKTVRPPTNFLVLRSEVMKELGNTAVRSPRLLKVIYEALTVLNEKFIGDISKPALNGFPDEYFTCTDKCLACNARCSLTVNHRERPHSRPDQNCRYLHCYDNRVFVCKNCVKEQRHQVVVPKAMESSHGSFTGLVKYALSGYVLECPHCGVIFRSRQYWYGNKDPAEVGSVQLEVCHVWPGENVMLTATRNAARQLLDGLGNITDMVSSYSAGPSKALGSWAADQVAPPYWVPNAQISHCKSCRQVFGELESKHHCRACGEGFCGDCTTKQRPVPERGWGNTPVRVCDACYSQSFTSSSSSDRSASPVGSGDTSAESQVAVRKLVENVTSTFGAVASVAIEMPRELIKDSARPTYWEPDHEISECCVCKEQFGPKLRIHHCRSCGKGVCKNCSPSLRPVPSRGWDRPSRVCTICFAKKGPL